LTGLLRACCNPRVMKSLLLALALLATTLGAIAGPLQDAAAAGDIGRVRALLLEDPSGVTARVAGTTALHEATRAGHLEVVKLLVEKGANVNATDFSGLTPLRLALGRRQLAIADYLRQHGGLERAPVASPPAAPPAVARTTPPASNPPVAPQTEPVPRTISPAPPVIPQSPAPASPQTPAVVQAPARTNNAATVSDMMPVIFPIHDAARIGAVEQIKFLFKNQPDIVDATDQKGLTPLHVAAANKQFEVARTLIGLRANLNARSMNGQTPLHVAVRNDDVAMTQLLLTNRASVETRDNFGNTPLLLALQSADAESLDAGGLGEKQTTTTGSLAVAGLKRQQLELATLLLNRGADVNARNQAGSTPLTEAVRLGNDAVVALLLQRSAKPNVVEASTGKAPLHVAAARGQLTIVDLLLKHGALVDGIDSRGETALCYALREGRTKTVAALRAAGGTTGTPKPLSDPERSLVEFYQRTEAALAKASGAEKGKLLIALNPTKADCERMFPRHGAAAWKVVEEINRQIRQAFTRALPDVEAGKEIWRITPEAPGPVVQEWRSRGHIAPDLPVFSLAVDKVGAYSRPGDYCFVNGRWVMVPPLRHVAAQFAAVER
jgi:ankyrin repeat protein